MFTRSTSAASVSMFFTKPGRWLYSTRCDMFSRPLKREFRLSKNTRYCGRSPMLALGESGNASPVLWRKSSSPYVQVSRVSVKLEYGRGACDASSALFALESAPVCVAASSSLDDGALAAAAGATSVVGG